MIHQANDRESLWRRGQKNPTCWIVKIKTPIGTTTIGGRIKNNFTCSSFTFRHRFPRCLGIQNLLRFHLKDAQTTPENKSTLTSPYFNGTSASRTKYELNSYKIKIHRHKQGEIKCTFLPSINPHKIFKCAISSSASRVTVSSLFTSLYSIIFTPLHYLSNFYFTARQELNEF